MIGELLAGDSIRFDAAVSLNRDLSLAMTASPNPVRTGTNVTYRITISNAGPASSRSFVVTDTLPAATTFVSCAATGGGVCSGSGNRRTVSFSDLGGGASATVTLVATVGASVAHGTAITNRARANSSSDPNSSNNSAAVTVTASNPAADLSVTQAASPNPVQVGANLTYTLTLRNAGPTAASSVTLTDTLPGATSFVSCTATGGGACGGAGNNRTVSFGSLAAGATATVTLVAKVGSAVADGTVINNRARVRASSPVDPDATDNLAAASVTASNPTADLSVTQAASPNPVQAGANLTYTLTVSNAGPRAASSVTVTDTLPGATSFVSCVAGFGGVCGGAGNNRTVSYGSLAVGASATVTLVAKVGSAVANGTVINNRARVRASSPVDPDATDNLAATSVTASNSSADLTVTHQSITPNPVAAGANLTYTLKVINRGPQAASSVTLTDTLPAGTSFVSCSATGGGVCGGSGSARTVSFGSLASEISVTATLVAQVGSTVADGTVLRNIARVQGTGASDPNTVNNASAASVTATNAGSGADLGVVAAASPNPVQVGANLTYTLTVSNAGPAAASSVTLTDTLPTATSFVSCAATGGGVCGGSARNRTVSFGSLAAGASATATLVAKVGSTVANGTVINNRARVSASSPVDPDASDNLATASATASSSSADLTVTHQSITPDPVAAGANLTYALKVINRGPQAASSVTLTDTLPAGTSFVSCSATSGGVCGGAGSARTVSFGSLASGTSVTATLVAKVGSTVADGTVLRNIARVQGTGASDPNTVNNTSVASVTATNAGSGADLGVGAVASPNPVQVGGNVTYTLTLSNAGPTAASSITLTDTLPVGTSYVSCAATGGGVCGGSARNRTVSFGSLAAGASATVTMVAKVSSTVAEGTVIRNTARVRASSPADPNAANDAATAAVTASSGGADVTVAKSAAPDPVAVGSNLTYTINVVNQGPAATSVTLTDTLPPWTSFVSCAATGGGICGGSAKNRTVSFGSLAAGASATVTLVAKVGTTTPDRTVIRNTARVSSTTADPNTVNNAASALVTAVKPGADLAITKTGSPNPVQLGSNLTYTLTVTNVGPAAASSVTVTDTLPTGTSFVSCVSNGGGVCGGSGKTRTISFGSLAAGASASVTLVAKVSSTLADGVSIRNTARVSASSPVDPDLSDNLAAVTVTGTKAPVGKVYYVAPTGSDANPGSATQPFRTPQKGVDVARSGDLVRVHAGTYSGVIMITRSGAPGRPITLRAYGDGPAILTAAHPALSCSNDTPTIDRTIQITRGTDHWRIEGLEVVGGILITGTSVGYLGDYIRDRSLPGRGMYNPVAARQTIEDFGADAADSIQVVNNRIRGRGVYALVARYGRIEGNEVYNVACGVGAAIFLNRFSDGWVVKGNNIHDLAASEFHWMSEGIRLVGASMYNRIENNTVLRVNGLGRGITMDINAGWNVIKGNTVSETDQALSEQFGSWGNQWIGNTSRYNRKFGLRIAAIDPTLTEPDDRIPRYVKMRCNKSVNDALALSIGWTVESEFDTNEVPTVQVGDNLLNYWPSSNNIWEGGTAPPPENPPSVDLSGCS